VTLLSAILSGVILAGNPASAEAPKPSPPNAAEAPPPSTYDQTLAQGSQNVSSSGDHERSLLGQIARTLLALVIVVAAIYIFARFGLQRWLGIRPVASGKALRVIERTPLDAKHALYIVEAPGGKTLLLGSGEGGVRLICELASEGQSRVNFESTMQHHQAQGAEHGDVNASS